MKGGVCLGVALHHTCSHVVYFPITQCDGNPCLHTGTWPPRERDIPCATCQERINEKGAIAEVNEGEARVEISEFDPRAPQKEAMMAISRALDTLRDIRNNSQDNLDRYSSSLAEKTVTELDRVLEDLIRQFVERMTLREKISINLRPSVDRGIEMALKKTLFFVKTLMVSFAFERALETLSSIEANVEKISEGCYGKELKKSDEEGKPDKHGERDDRNNSHSSNEDDKAAERFSGKESKSSGENGQSDPDPFATLLKL